MRHFNRHAILALFIISILVGCDGRIEVREVPPKLQEDTDNDFEDAFDFFGVEPSDVDSVQEPPPVDEDD